MSAAHQLALEDPKPTYEELEQKVAELTGLLHVAFVSICTLQCERDRARWEADPNKWKQEAAFLHRLRRDGIKAMLLAPERKS